jgi:hypothetical protein
MIKVVTERKSGKMEKCPFFSAAVIPPIFICQSDLPSRQNLLLFRQALQNIPAFTNTVTDSYCHDTDLPRRALLSSYQACITYVVKTIHILQYVVADSERTGFAHHYQVPEREP